MYEVEVKVRADHDAVRDRLDARGATRWATLEQVDTYYDAPDRDFATTDEALRVRVERPLGDDATSRDGTGERTLLTYKGPLVDDDSKTRREAETRVADGEAIREILEGLDFAPAAEVRKERAHFDLDDYAVTLDAVDGLGEFVEVETEVAGDVDAARAGAFEVLRGLGLDPDEQIRTSYLGLLLAQRDGE